MMKGKFGLKRYLVEIKIGVFFIAALVLFFIFIISIREMSFFKGTYSVAVKFNFAEGLKSASPVRFCGVGVGEVKTLEVKSEDGIPVVYVYTKIENGINIPEGSRFIVNSLSLFGEKYLEIIPPDYAVDSYIKDKDIVRGVDPVLLFNVLSGVHQAVSKLEGFIAGDNSGVSLEETIVNINGVAKDLRGLIADIKGKEGTLGMLFYDDVLYEKIDEFFQDIKDNPWKLLYKPAGKRRK